MPQMPTMPKTSLLAPFDESGLVVSDLLSDEAGDEKADGRCRRTRTVTALAPQIDWKWPFIQFCLVDEVP